MKCDIKGTSAQQYLYLTLIVCQTTCFNQLNGHHQVFPRKGYNNTEGCVHLRDPGSVYNVVN